MNRPEDSNVEMDVPKIYANAVRLGLPKGALATTGLPSGPVRKNAS